MRKCHAAIEGLERLITNLHDPSGRRWIVATPRFAIPCSYGYLKKKIFHSLKKIRASDTNPSGGKPTENRGDTPFIFRI